MGAWTVTSVDYGPHGTTVLILREEGGPALFLDLDDIPEVIEALANARPDRPGLQARATEARYRSRGHPYGVAPEGDVTQLHPETFEGEVQGEAEQVSPWAPRLGVILGGVVMTVGMLGALWLVVLAVWAATQAVLG